MEQISVFDIFKIGVGPSSSHTMGPWRAAQQFTQVLESKGLLNKISNVKIDLFGSLAKTGRGHGTDIAVILGLGGEDPVTIDTTLINTKIATINSEKKISLKGKSQIEFNPAIDIVFHYNQSLPFHPNALTFTAITKDNVQVSETYYSIGGGFVVQEKENVSSKGEKQLPFPIETAADLTKWCIQEGKPISGIVLENEKVWRSLEETYKGILNIWHTMRECIYRGCHTDGTLPGGLKVTRRACDLNKKLLGNKEYRDIHEWQFAVSASGKTFGDIINWVSCFALAVNEENASFGRVVTAPTNGAAGVIPAVLMYYNSFYDESNDDNIVKFITTAAEIGSIFKKGSTISAAMGGCQAEIGVSSAMAAAALTEVLGGTPQQVQMAAEIAMEHHLGLTCDPIGGLVQIPCIERNTMGAMKAITASQLSISGNPASAVVSLDGVIKTMWETAKDMNAKYKETSDGGLAINISVNLSEC